MDTLIRVIVVRPLERPVVAEIVNTLEGLYSVCGSPVDVLRLAPGIDLWCNDEGRINGMPPNRDVRVPGGFHRIFGPLLLARSFDGDTVSLTDEDLSVWLPLTTSGWRVAS